MPGILHANCEQEKKNHSHKYEFDKQTSQENIWSPQSDNPMIKHNLELNQ